MIVEVKITAAGVAYLLCQMVLPKLPLSYGDQDLMVLLLDAVKQQYSLAQEACMQCVQFQL
jgi:hypothetical protein